MHDPAAMQPSHNNCELIAQLLSDALAALEGDCAKARRDILHARALVLEPSQPASPVAGGFAGWQMRRITNFVHFNLSTKLRIEQVASALKVSPGYLSRAFKATAGVTYSEFVAHARIELAKRLLLTTDTPISEIALACGLTDQSHLTRLFKRSVGSPPAAWRRQYRDGAVGDSPLPNEGAGEAGQLDVGFDGVTRRGGEERRRLQHGDIVIFRGEERGGRMWDARTIWDRLEIVAMALHEQGANHRYMVLTASVVDPSRDGERDRTELPAAVAMGGGDLATYR